MTVRPGSGFLRSPTIIAQIVATGGGEAVNRVAQIVVVALAAQALGANGLGIIGIAWSLTAVALALIQGGPELTGVRELGLGDRAPHPPDQMIATVTWLKLGLVIGAVPVLVAEQWLLGHADGPALRQLAAQMVAMGLIAAGYVWALRGLCRPFDQGLVRVVQAGAMLAVFVVLVQVWRSPLTVPAAEAAGALLALVVARHRLGRLARGPAPSIVEVRSLAVPSLNLGLAGLATTLAWMVPLMAAARWVAVAEVGQLTGVLRLLLGCVGIMQIGFQSLFPLLTRVGAVDPLRGREATFVLALHAGLATLAVVVPLAAAAPLLLPAILGPDFVAAAPLFRWLIPILLPIAISSPISYALMARGETWLVARIAIGSAVATAVACFALFWWAPTASSVLVLHPVVWGQALVTMAIGLRRGVIGVPHPPWHTLLDPRRIGTLLRVDR